jgi:F-type H+-transporting ATPase subunit gamma
MSETTASLRHKIANAEYLESVVHTIKAIAASNIGQYENAVRSLVDYYRTVQLGLAVCLCQDEPHTDVVGESRNG